MLHLILLIAGVFVLLWFGDLLITLRTIKSTNHKFELNPIQRFIFKMRSKFIYLAKIIEIAIFLYLIVYITKLNGSASFNILVGFIIVYGLIVLNNSIVYSRIFKKQSTIFGFIYFGLLIAIVLFIYLNFMLYQDLGTTYNAIQQSNDEYNQLLDQCRQTNENVTSEYTSKMDDVLKDLNIPIRGAEK